MYKFIEVGDEDIIAHIEENEVLKEWFDFCCELNPFEELKFKHLDFVFSGSHWYTEATIKCLAAYIMHIIKREMSCQ
tara:strand:+ start:372 stop:602 length:231 start_codon:yes stop_codon:yes gene_type:complete